MSSDIIFVVHSITMENVTQIRTLEEKYNIKDLIYTDDAFLLTKKRDFPITYLLAYYFEEKNLRASEEFRRKIKELFPKKIRIDSYASFKELAKKEYDF